MAYERQQLRTPIVFEIADEDPYENVFDQKDNTILAMRHVSWNEREPKLELRKWILSDDETEKDIPNKGFSFLTEEGPDKLAEILVKEGYGDTNTLMELLNNRDENTLVEEKKITDDDFLSSIKE